VNGVEKLLKLSTTVSTTNMHLFDKDCKLRKYASVEEIIDAFYSVRLEAYDKRKASLIENMRRKLCRLSNRARYIQLNLDGTVDLRRKRASAIDGLLDELEFDRLDGDYRYLVKMSMDSVLQENVDSILKEKADTEREMEVLQNTTIRQMWLSELAKLEGDYDAYKTCREREQSNSKSGDAKKKSGASSAKPKSK
jgi:DNA topoisomerase-2